MSRLELLILKIENDCITEDEIAEYLRLTTINFYLTTNNTDSKKIVASK